MIDSHLSRRTVAGTLQPPSRKQPGKPCFLCGVAPDRVYSNGRFRTPLGALLPHLSTLTSSAQTSYPSLRRKRQSSYIPLRLLCRQSGALPAFGDGKTSYPSLCHKKQSLYIPFFLLCRQSGALLAFLAQTGDIACSLLTGIKGRGGIFLLHFSSDRSGRALPVILALWSPDFPHDAAVGLHLATVRPGRACIVPDSRPNVKQVAIFF